MNMVLFVRKNRPRWERLEALLTRFERKRMKGVDRATLDELSSLYRACTSDLAFAQTYYRGTTLLQFLHQLVGRAHHQVYRTEGFTLGGVRRFFRYDVPEAVRAHFPAIVLAAIVLLTAFALGLAAAQADERVGLLVLPPGVMEEIDAGRMWTKNIFSAAPSSVVSTVIFSNNVSVALMCFVGGLTCGVYTTFALVLNGFTLGVVFKLCARHGLLLDLFEFIASHGFVELSCIVVAGAAGYTLASALVVPGSLSRADALAVRGRSAVRMALGCIGPLIVIGIVEAFVSPSSIPAWFKITLGIALGVAFWAYLLMGGRSRPEVKMAATAMA